MVGEEWTFRNCLCRSTWYLNSTMTIRQLSTSFTGVNVAPRVRKFTHSLPRVLLFRTVLPATWFQIVLCISNSWKQNPVGKHVRLKNSITDRKLKRPLGSFAQSRKTHLWSLSFGSASFHNYSVGQTTLLVFLPNKQFLHMLVKLSFFFQQSWICKSILSGNYPYKRQK